MNPKKQHKKTNPLILFKGEEDMVNKLKKVFKIKEEEKEEGKKNMSIYPTGREEVTEVRLNSNNYSDLNQLYWELKRYAHSYGYYRYYYIHNRYEPNQKRSKYTYYDTGEERKKIEKQKKKKDGFGSLSDKLKDKQEVFDVQELNAKLKGNDDINDQYWEDKGDIDNFNAHKNKINGLLEEMSKEDDEKKNKTALGALGSKIKKKKKKVFVSGLLSKLVKQKKKNVEEPDNNDDDDVNPNALKATIANNSAIKSFISANLKNKLNNVQDLLKGSKKYQDAKKQVKNGKYTDYMFAANGESIYGFGDRNDYSKRECDEFEWKRAREIFGDEEIHVYKDIEPDDILQGGLGDCYFLAALSAIAENKNRIQKIFLTKEYNSEGIYVIAMCIEGIWQEIILDDLVPCVAGRNEPAFNTSKTNELWVILLEKAWAKIHGGYLNIAAGLTREALRDLTGACAKTFFTSRNKEELWQQLLEADKKNYIMTAGSDDLNSGSDDYLEKIGICGSHAYSLLAAYELEYYRGTYKINNPNDDTGRKKIERIVKLRNPWGTGEWHGDWSDDSPLWNDQLKKDLNFVDRDDGTFYMTYKDFCKYYSDCQICYYHDDYKYSAIAKQSGPDDTIYFKFKVTEEGEYYFSINQKNKRMFPKANGYKYSSLSFMIAKVDQVNDVYEYIGGAMKSDKENWFSKLVQTGEYMAIIKTPWTSFVNEFSFSIYGPGTTDIKEVEEKNLPNGLIPNILKSHAKKDDSTYFNTFAGQGHYNVKYKTFDNKGGFGYIYFQNDSDDFVLNATVELIGSYNIELCAPLTGLRPKLTVLPETAEIIAYKAINLPYSTQMRLLSSFTNKNMDKKIKEDTKKSNYVIKKTLNGKEVNIKMFISRTAHDLNIVYVNNTSNYTLRESIEFNLENCHIEGAYGNYVEIVCQPGEERLLELHDDDNDEPWSADIKKIWYSIC